MSLYSLCYNPIFAFTIVPAPPRVRRNVRPLSQTMSRRARLSVNRGFSPGFPIVEGKHLGTPISYPVHLRMENRIFVPPEKNTLVDLLLARSVTGESPNKAATSSIPTTSKERQPPCMLSRSDRNARQRQRIKLRIGETTWVSQIVVLFVRYIKLQ